MGIILKKIKRFFIGLLLFAIVAAALLYGGYRWYEDYKHSQYESLHTLAGQEIIRCAEMVSIKSVYTDIISIKRSAVFGIAQSVMLVKYTGTIRAGISDISAITYTVSEDRKSINVQLPKSVVLSNDITEQKVFDEINNLFVPITTQDVFSEIDSARKAQEKTLIAAGFLKDADSYAAQLLTRVFSAMGFEIITIETKKSEYAVPDELSAVLRTTAPLLDAAGKKLLDQATPGTETTNTPQTGE